MGRRADPCAAVDAEADVPALARVDRARVEAHPNAQRPPVRPGVPLEGVLSLHGDRCSVPRTGKGDEERVSLCVDLVPLVSGERVSEQASVRVEHVDEPRPELLEQRGRSFDVGEEKGDGARRLRCHARPDQPQEGGS